ncbi:MAG: hypothetical protein CMF96_11655 [Candidatus Marinimicrobia bacterium]|nr:hypothetical protein [Candidatus Neomarinimicrobiota bacterium]
MIPRIILLIAILSSQESVGSWKSYTSFHHIKSCENSSENIIYCLTDGGLIEFDFFEKTTELISINDGLTKSSNRHFQIDNQNFLWIANNNQNLILDFYSIIDSDFTEQKLFENIDIFKMVTSQFDFIGLYKQNDEVGLLHFKFIDGKWNYKDFYNNIDESINDIYDLKILKNLILISSNSGIFQGSLEDNLKVSTNWSNIFYSNEALYFSKGDNIQWYNSNEISTFLDSSLIESLLLNDINNIVELIDLNYKYIITENDFYIYYLNDCIFHYSNEFSSKFIDMNFNNNKIFISIEKHGILEFDIKLKEFISFFPLPNTILNKEFSAISIINDNHIVGVGSYGISHFNGYNWKNHIPSSISLNYNSKIFNNVVSKYKLGSGGDGSIFPSWSIIESNNNTILFGNTQIRPDNPGYAGALINLNLENNNITVFDTTNQVLDGMDGVYNSDWYNRNLLVNQIKKDPSGNIWVLNPYAESDSNIIAIKPINNENWVHIKHPNEGVYFMPTEIDFDSRGRAWVGFENRTSLENISYSDGGLKVLLIIGEIGDNFEYYWKDISNPEILPDNSIWSVAVDKQDFIWIVTSNGIQGYSSQYNDFTLSPIYLIDFYNYLPLFRGDHIRVDSQDNKWISTRHSGVKVILENTQYWPDAEGFTQENSGLLSNHVNDIVFDEKNGYVWFSTDLGISRLGYPINSKHVKKNKLLFHPNPFKMVNDDLIIEGCFPNSTIMINDINGNHIKTFKAQYLGEASSQIRWNGKDENGNFVNSGVYLVSSRSDDGMVKIGKLAVIKQ